MFLDVIMIFFPILNFTITCSEVKFSSFNFMDRYRSRATSQNFMKELSQSDLLFLSYGSGYISTPKIKKKRKLDLYRI